MNTEKLKYYYSIIYLFHKEKGNSKEYYKNKNLDESRINSILQFIEKLIPPSKVSKEEIYNVADKVSQGILEENYSESYENSQPLFHAAKKILEIKKNNDEKNENKNSIELYISYNTLTVKSMKEILDKLDKIFEIISCDLVIRERNVNFPVLEIVEVHTGNSIKWKFKEGYLPSVKPNKEGDIEISVPKAYSIPLFLGWAILSIAEKGYEIKEKQYDVEMKKIELKLLEREFHNLGDTEYKLKDTTQILNSYLNENVSEVKPIVKEMIRDVLRNDEIINFKVNNLEIKGEKRSASSNVQNGNKP